MADSPATTTQPSAAAAAPAATDRPVTPPAAEPATKSAAAPPTSASPTTAPATTEAATTEAATTAPTPAPAPAPAPDQLIEAEDGSSVSDGASIDERISSYTASLASSAVDYPLEHGRRYHAFRSGKAYFMPNDEPEMDRLDLVHATAVKMLGDRLYTAPLEVDKVHSILDIGTGTGIWAMEMGDMFPNAEVFGIDLSAIQPSWVPPNVRFEIDDIESPWIDRKYDYIFCRYMLGAVKDWPKLVQNIYDHLNPGGWVEFLDVNGDFYSTDGTYTEKHSTHKWITTLLDTMDSLGRTCRLGTKFEEWTKDAGFQNVKHQKYLIPIGPWAKDPYYQELGLMNLAQILEGLDGFTMRIFCGVLGWTKTEAEVLLVEVRNELKKLHTFHAQFDK
ncbi:methyltransferase [Colletotrichum plurivorum]|uniref:Methyltransferase n=1 Tax=Colletotrichum plurivorum TaxID=2175906 RepID=A0A8H6NFA3_9PEZI|nr:methyltransferase [Colletotrichum plurivorum]